MAVGPLAYKIYGHASDGPFFSPENITRDAPHDLASRWSAGTSGIPTWIGLRLEKPAVISEYFPFQEIEDH